MSDLVHRRFRAPQHDGAALIDPPLGHAAALIAANRARTARLGRSWGYSAELIRQARRLLLDQPRIGIEPDTDVDVGRPIIATGHQPELFHPGVWFKNFLAASIAGQANGWAVNVVVDNDLVHTTSLRVPTSASLTTHVTDVAFDAPLEPMTWENRYVASADTFRTFADQVRPLFQPLMAGGRYSSGMILDRFWPLAVASLEAQLRDFSGFAKPRTQRCDAPAANAPPFAVLSECLTAARRQIEAECGIVLHDCPISVVADQTPFFEFMRLVLARHRELHDVHNRALHEYRAANRIRSQSHPVPALATEGQWLEVPFWMWTREDPRRRRVFVRAAGKHLEISDAKQTTVLLPKDSGDDYGRLLARKRVKLRPRALITTMYARLVLSDLFIHGIGGAKYDELTDLIIRRFFGIEPPAYLTATATFRLPIERPGVAPDDVRQSAQRIRELRYRPESFVREPAVKEDAGLAAKLAALAAEKREYLSQHDLRRGSPDIFAGLDRLNRAMHELLKPVERELRARHGELLQQLKLAQLLGSREFSFVLFPSEILPARLLDLCKLPP